MEIVFLDAIREDPDDDVHRLVFADWLEENGQAERAEFIRLQCQMEPYRDFFEDDTINARHIRIYSLLRQSDPSYTSLQRQEWLWFWETCGRDGRLPSPDLQWRRGFVDTLAVHVTTWLRHGNTLQQRYPLLRKLVLFGLNGWGVRLAECPWLAGLPELELACWYANEDAQALAHSPHLNALERLVVWSRETPEQATILARAPAWPHLRNLHLIAALGQQTGWIDAVNVAAGRPLGSTFVFDEQPYPLAANFYDSWTPWISAGKLPDGTQLILHYDYEPPPGELAVRFDEHFDPTTIPVVIRALAFDADGTVRPEPFRVPLPRDLWWKKGYPSLKEEKHLFRNRMDFLRQSVGFVPAFIRVRDFDAENWLGVTAPFWGADARETDWGTEDPPGADPAHDDSSHGGHGAVAYHWVRQGCFRLSRFGNDITFTRTGRSDGDHFVPW